MKKTRRVTPKMVAASRENGKRSPGPKTDRGKAWSSRNAIKHGLLSRAVTFESELDKLEFNELYAGLIREHRPRTVEESFWVQELAVCFWRAVIALRWELAAVSSRRQVPQLLTRAMSSSASDPRDEAHMPFLDECDDVLERTSAGWDCSEFSVRMERSRDSGEHSRRQTARAVQTPVHMGFAKEFERAAGNDVTVTLKNSLELIMRYAPRIKKDIERASEQLRLLRKMNSPKELASKGA